jgi:hypothetical protein
MPWMCCRTEKEATEGGNERASGLWAGRKWLEGGVGPLTRIFQIFAKIKGTKIDGSLKDLKPNLNNLNLENLIVVGNKISNINQNTLITEV